MRRLILSLSALAFCLGAPAHAETSQDEQFWLNLTSIGSIKDDLVYFAEIQPRVGDGISRIDQALFRGAMGWKFSPSVTVYQGFAHIVVPVESGKDVNEERSFQQINWTLGRQIVLPHTPRAAMALRWR